MHSAKKIGVLTFHRCINYGSYWQARCLIEGLHSIGFDAELLEHVSHRVNRAEWRCALQPIVSAQPASSERNLYKAKARRFFQAFETLPLSRPFNLESPRDLDDYDVIVVGSDEVWNLQHPWYGGYSLFYGDGLRAKRIVSYAASFGNQPAAWGLDRAWADKLRNFSAVSVRDHNSMQLLSDALGERPELVLDPCLQFPPQATEPAQESDKTYVAVYGHSFPHWFAHQVRNWADSNGHRLVSIGYRNDWADEQWIAAGPIDYAHFIAGAEAVATNFFHGCVFALLNQKPFACVLSDYRSNKVRDLTSLLGAERHLVHEDAPQLQYDQALGEPLDPIITDRLGAMRLQSSHYLDHALA